MANHSDDLRVTAYVFDELPVRERLAFEAEMEQSAELRQLVAETRDTVESLRGEMRAEEKLVLSPEQRNRVLAGLAGADATASPVGLSTASSGHRNGRAKRRLWRWLGGVGAVAAAVVLMVSCWSLSSYRRSWQSQVAIGARAPAEMAREVVVAEHRVSDQARQRSASLRRTISLPAVSAAPSPATQPHAAEADGVATALSVPYQQSDGVRVDAVSAPADQGDSAGSISAGRLALAEGLRVRELATRYRWQALGGLNGPGGYGGGYQGGNGVGHTVDELERLPADSPHLGLGPGAAGDRYDVILENEFVRANDAPLSTFSIDVDTASYAKVRMFLSQHRQLPRPDAVRIEELVNYFPYSYEPPADERPFAAHLAAAACPWNPDHRLVRIGIKGREMPVSERPASNLVFLLDVSGSMDQAQKLPLLKRGMKLLVDQLSENDRVAIVVYAGAAGLVLDSTTGDQKAKITQALERLSAGGSTNGGQGIQLAYQTALDHFIPGGVNRVILCTDGDFNVGTTGTGQLVRMVEGQARAGVFLSVLGFGIGNHNDAMLEQVSNKGNGNYAFVDTEREARKVLVDQLSATLVTIAKDVKIQVQFHPARVAAYRLIGYENRLLAAQDFNDDTKDAGEIGAGHTVTALYEVVPADSTMASTPSIDPVQQQVPGEPAEAAAGDELLTLKLRYKEPDGDTSALLEFRLPDRDLAFSRADRDFQFAAAVAGFGMLLRDSRYKGDATYAGVLEIAAAAAADDTSGYRQEFLDLVRTAAGLSGGDHGQGAR
jgi:Ca-activated chloride channel family protein